MRVAVEHALRGDVQDRAEPLALALVLHLVGLGDGEVLVHLADHPHRLGDRARSRCRPIRSPTVSKPRSTAARTSSSTGSSSPRGRDLAEALGDHGRGPVDQVAPAGDELGVVAGDEVGPGERGVRGLGAGRADEVAQRVGPVAGQEVADVEHVPAAGRELLVAHREVLARDDLGRQVEYAVLPRLAAAVALAGVGEQLGRPDLGVEGDVVLAHEVVGQRLGVVPPVAPAIRLALAARPLDRRRQVADDRVEPDVETLGRAGRASRRAGSGSPSRCRGSSPAGGSP